ncbi:hypothetical protein D3C80_1841510 [compost metagenome]
MALPSISKHRINVIFRDNLTNDLCGKIAIVASKCVGHINAGKCPVLARASIPVDGHPFGVCLRCIRMDCMRIDTGHNVHPQFACPFDDRAKGVRSANEFGHIV